jgi:hypothetical protein
MMNEEGKELIAKKKTEAEFLCPPSSDLLLLTADF